MTSMQKTTPSEARGTSAAIHANKQFRRLIEEADSLLGTPPKQGKKTAGEEEVDIADQWDLIRPEECRQSITYFDSKKEIHSQIQTRILASDGRAPRKAHAGN